MTSLASNRQAAGASADPAMPDPTSTDFAASDFAMPDFLDLAGEASGARFSCSSSTVDGGVLVFDDHLILVTGTGSERVELPEVTGWEVALDGTVWIVTVQTAHGAYSARIHPAFAAAAVSALEAEFGPASTA